jgi:hypothetical protein
VLSCEISFPHPFPYIEDNMPMNSDILNACTVKLLDSQQYVKGRLFIILFNSAFRINFSKCKLKTLLSKVYFSLLVAIKKKTEETED